MRTKMICLALAGALLAPASAAAELPRKKVNGLSVVDFAGMRPGKSRIAALKSAARKARGDRIDVFVIYRTYWLPEAQLTPSLAKTQRGVLALANRKIEDDVPSGHGRLLRDYDGKLPFVAMRLDATAIQDLSDSPYVARIERVARGRELDVDSGVAAASAVSNRVGATGAGQTVAVIDSGVVLDHPYLKGRVYDGACYSAEKDCPNGGTIQVGGKAGQKCSGCSDHGTHVAGIVAGSHPRIGDGVAPGARIYPIMARSNTSTDYYYSAADVTAGIQQAADLAKTHKIAAVTMSLGMAGPYTAGKCAEGDGWLAMSTAIESARKAGVAVIASAGNSANRDAIHAPACLPGVISVGAVDNSDVVANFSEASSDLDLWAPGVDVASSIAGPAYVSLSGTSMAAPHVAGAFAVLRQLAPQSTVTPDQLLGLITATGKAVKDTRSGGTVTKPRLDVYAAVNALLAKGWRTGPYDLRAPVHGDSDFDGDGAKDIAVWRPSNGTWYWIGSKTGAHGPGIAFGRVGDMPVPGDYDGDGTTDVAVFRVAEGAWYTINSSTGAHAAPVKLGQAGDVPVPGDWNGDGAHDLGVFHPPTGAWKRVSAGGTVMPEVVFGRPTDVPVPADYDGDGVLDVAVWRPSDGNWNWKRSSDGAFGTPVPFGRPTDIPVTGDFDGDKRADVAVYRSAERKLHWKRSSDGGFGEQSQSALGGVSIQSADYNADGKTDPGFVAFDSTAPETLTWARLGATTQFGVLGDVMVR